MGRPGSEHRSMLRRSRSLLIDSLPCRLQDYILHLYGSIDVMGRGGGGGHVKSAFYFLKFFLQTFLFLLVFISALGSNVC